MMLNSSSFSVNYAKKSIRKISNKKYCTYNIIYLDSSRPYIEICRVCKIYGRRGGAEPSMYFYKPDISALPSIDFTNPTYFYVLSKSDQMGVLFRRGP